MKFVTQLDKKIFNKNKNFASVIIYSISKILKSYALIIKVIEIF